MAKITEFCNRVAYVEVTSYKGWGSYGRCHTVDTIHRDPRFDLEVAKEHLKNTDLYGFIDGNVIMHIAAVLGSIKRQKDQDDLDDYYSDFDLQ